MYTVTDSKNPLKGVAAGFDGIFMKIGGYQCSSGLSLSLFFNAGLSNISKVPDQTIRSLDAFGFSIGFMFGSASNE